MRQRTQHVLCTILCAGVALAVLGGCRAMETTIDVETRGGVVCTLAPSIGVSCTINSPNHEVVGALVNGAYRGTEIRDMSVAGTGETNWSTAIDFDAVTPLAPGERFPFEMVCATPRCSATLGFRTGGVESYEYWTVVVTTTTAIND